jgi:hypothetical protein
MTVTENTEFAQSYKAQARMGRDADGFNARLARKKTGDCSPVLESASLRHHAAFADTSDVCAGAAASSVVIITASGPSSFWRRRAL